MTTEPDGARPLLQVRDLVKEYPLRSASWRRRHDKLHAVNGVSFDIAPGETLALVGESGCGKSTVAKTIMRFTPPTSGEVLFEGSRIDQLSQRELRPWRRQAQFVFQDPYASLPSRMTIRQIVAEPLDVNQVGSRYERRNRVAELLEMVGVQAEMMSRFPHELSGGQRQRVGIARALALGPKLLVLDEPVSALDVSIQAQVINLLARLQRELDLTYLFISHDLGVVRHLAHRVAVMYLGRIVEIGRSDDVFERPRHPYTKALLSAVPAAEPGAQGFANRVIIDGDVPDPLSIPSGCAFHTRCPHTVADSCRKELPELRGCPSTGEPAGPEGSAAACHFPLEWPTAARQRVLNAGSDDGFESSSRGTSAG